MACMAKNNIDELMSFGFDIGKDVLHIFVSEKWDCCDIEDGRPQNER